MRCRRGGPERLTIALPRCPGQPTLVLPAAVPVPLLSPPSAFQPANSLASPPPPPGAELNREAHNSPSARASPRASPLLSSTLRLHGPGPSTCPPAPARLPFLTLSSSPPAEAVVTTTLNAVVLTALSSPRPRLGPLNPSRPPRLGQRVEGGTEASKVEHGPESAERAGTSPAGAHVPPLLHTCTRGTQLPPATAASQTRRRAVTFHPAPSARGASAASRAAALLASAHPSPSTPGPPSFSRAGPLGVKPRLPSLATALAGLA